MISQGPSICIFNKDDAGEVLASWLFCQFMLTNDVQMAYSQTEGYVPVTAAAQNSPEYLDYLSRGGEDNELYYDVKITATKMLIDNVENTFTTPVFNGSALLRNAAGEMIEEVTKSTTRKEKIDDNYMEKLFSEMTALYRLDQIDIQEGKTRPGPLPKTSVVLLCTIGAIWVGIAVYWVISYVKTSKKRKN